jgi:hypothetical protein
MSTGLKAPPPFVKNAEAWSYTLAKLADKGHLDSDGNPVNYGEAVGIYKNVLKKHFAFDADAIDRIELTYREEFADRALTVLAASLTWVPMRGCLLATQGETDYLLSPFKRFNEDGHPLHAWRLSVAAGDNTKTLVLPAQTAAHIVANSPLAAQAFTDSTKALIADVGSHWTDGDKDARDACGARLHTLKEALKA